MTSKLHVRVKPSAGKQEIEDFGDYHYLVHVKSPAEKNEANIEMLKLLGKHLGVPSTKLRIISGAGNKDKVVEIEY